MPGSVVITRGQQSFNLLRASLSLARSVHSLVSQLLPIFGQPASMGLTIPKSKLRRPGPRRFICNEWLLHICRSVSKTPDKGICFGADPWQFLWEIYSRSSGWTPAESTGRPSSASTFTSAHSASTVITDGCGKYILCPSCFLSYLSYQICPDHGERLSKRRIDPYTELVISRQDSRVIRAIKQENGQHLKMALDDGEWRLLDTLDENKLAPIHLVARSGWSRGAKLLLEATASTEARNCQGLTPLMTAVRYRQRDIMQLLLESEKGVDVNTTTRWDGSVVPPGCTPSTALHLAAFADDSKVTKMLLDAGAYTSINAKSKKGSPLGIAATRNNMAVVEVLVKTGANPNETGFHILGGPNMTSRLLTG